MSGNLDSAFTRLERSYYETMSKISELRRQVGIYNETNPLNPDSYMPEKLNEQHELFLQLHREEIDLREKLYQEKRIREQKECECKRLIAETQDLEKEITNLNTRIDKEKYKKMEKFHKNMLNALSDSTYLKNVVFSYLLSEEVIEDFEYIKKLNCEIFEILVELICFQQLYFCETGCDIESMKLIVDNGMKNLINFDDKIKEDRKTLEELIFKMSGPAERIQVSSDLEAEKNRTFTVAVYARCSYMELRSDLLPFSSDGSRQIRLLQEELRLETLAPYIEKQFEQEKLLNDSRYRFQDCERELYRECLEATGINKKLKLNKYYVLNENKQLKIYNLSKKYQGQHAVVEELRENVENLTLKYEEKLRELTTLRTEIRICKLDSIVDAENNVNQTILENKFLKNKVMIARLLGDKILLHESKCVFSAEICKLEEIKDSLKKERDSIREGACSRMSDDKFSLVNMYIKIQTLDDAYLKYGKALSRITFWTKRVFFVSIPNFLDSSQFLESLNENPVGPYKAKGNELEIILKERVNFIQMTEKIKDDIKSVEKQIKTLNGFF